VLDGLDVVELQGDVEGDAVVLEEAVDLPADGEAAVETDERFSGRRRA